MNRFDALDRSRGGALLGREAELGHLRAALERARSGRGALFLIGGEPGVGKSRLADEFASVARKDDAIVLWGKCWEGGGAPAYWPWIQALRGFLRDADPAEARRVLGAGAAHVALMLPEIRDLIPDLPPAPPESDSARFQLFDSTVRLLRDMSRERPAVVVLDDLHAADTPSILLLRFLATQLESLQIVAVGMYRDIELTPDHPLTAAMAELSREPTASVVALHGLPEDLVGEFIESRTGQAPAERLSRELWRETNGNPLFLGEALRLLDSERRLNGDAGGGALRLAVPAGVREVIRRRLAQLSPATVRILTIASAIGPEFALEDLRRVERKAQGDLLETIGEALQAGLVVPVAVSVDRYRFFHDLVRESLYDDLLPADRADLHRQIAVSLADAADADGTRTAELAHHYFEAAQAGPEADRQDIALKAQAYAARAAEAAVGALAYEEAARLYRISLAALDQSGQRDDRLRAALLLAVGEANALAGDLESAQHAYLQAADLARRSGDVESFAQAVLGYGGRVPWTRPGTHVQIIPLLEEALMLLGDTDEQLRVRLMTRLACAWRSSPDKRAQSDALSREAVEAARRLGAPATLGYALIGRYYAIMWPENPDERLRLAEETVAVARASGDGELMVDGALLLWLSATEQGHRQTARIGLDDVGRLTRDLRQPAQLSLGIGPRALIALMEGDFDEAERLIDDELDVWQPFSYARDNVSAARMHRFLLSHERDTLADAEAEVRAAVDEFPWYPLHRAALTLTLIGLGRRDEAARVFGELARDRFTALYRDNEWLLGSCMAAEAAVLLEDGASAAVLYEHLLPFAGRHAIGHAEGSVGVVDRYLGLLAVLLDRVDEGIEHLEQGVTLNENLGARPWAAWARRDLARALRRRADVGDLDRAADLEAAALERAQRLGMIALERELVPAGEAARSGAAGPEPVPEAALASHVGVFRLEGEYWTIQFGDDSFRLRDAKGLRYLRRLLAQPGNELHALDLAQESSGAGAASSGGAELESDPMAGAGPRLDDDAKAAYRARVAELREELDEAQEWNDPERADRARMELQFLARELAGAVGLGGRDRSAVSPAERARVSVTRAIRLAMSKLAPHSAELSQHLDATIHTGTYCVYRPDPRAPIEWRH